MAEPAQAMRVVASTPLAAAAPDLRTTELPAETTPNSTLPDGAQQATDEQPGQPAALGAGPPAGTEVSPAVLFPPAKKPKTTKTSGSSERKKSQTLSAAEVHKASVRVYLEHTVVPTLMDAMQQVARQRPPPQEALSFVIKYLQQREAEQQKTSTPHEPASKSASPANIALPGGVHRATGFTVAGSVPDDSAHTTGDRGAAKPPSVAGGTKIVLKVKEGLKVPKAQPLADTALRGSAADQPVPMQT